MKLSERNWKVFIPLGPSLIDIGRSIFLRFKKLIRKRRSLVGFTLVEMGIVLVIILAFLSMSVPFFANFSSSTGLNTAYREVSTLLKTARSYAITQNKDFNAVFDLSVIPNKFWIEDASSKIIIDKGYSLPAGVSFTEAATVVFTPTGALAENSATRTVIKNNRGKTKIITINSVTGTVEVE